jgi:hypothetical protein
MTSSVVYFNFIFQWFIAFIVDVLNFLLLSLSLGILFYCLDIVNGIVFLNDLPVSSFLRYRKTNDFCKLLLYSAPLLKAFMTLRSFFW